MTFLELLNKVARVAKPAHLNFDPITDMDIKFTETDIDSLDGMIVVMYMAIIYGIPDEIVKDFTPETPQELCNFLTTHKTTEPESIEAAMEMIK